MKKQQFSRAIRKAELAVHLYAAQPILLIIERFAHSLHDVFIYASVMPRHKLWLNCYAKNAKKEKNTCIF